MFWHVLLPLGDSGSAAFLGCGMDRDATLKLPGVGTSVSQSFREYREWQTLGRPSTCFVAMEVVTLEAWSYS